MQPHQGQQAPQQISRWHRVWQPLDSLARVANVDDQSNFRTLRQSGWALYATAPATQIDDAMPAHFQFSAQHRRGGGDEAAAIPLDHDLIVCNQLEPPRRKG